MGTGVQRRSLFLLARTQEEEPGRKGLSRRGLKESAGRFSPFPLSREIPMTEPLLGGASAAPLSMRATAVVASAVVRAARQLFTDLERSRRIDATTLRNAMDAAFGASDASGAWNWKTAYDACEAATVLFLRRYGAAMRAKAASPAAMLPMLVRITNLLPTHTRRSEESESLQQFSTPIGLAFVANIAAAITPADVVLEPSAGTGLLAILAELAGACAAVGELVEKLSGFSETMRDRLRAYGLFGEIISWKLRMFVPTDATGIGVLAKVLERYPIERVGAWEAA
jgi:hypothetical protein